MGLDPDAWTAAHMGSALRVFVHRVYVGQARRVNVCDADAHTDRQAQRRSLFVILFFLLLRGNGATGLESTKTSSVIFNSNWILLRFESFRCIRYNFTLLLAI